VLEGHRDMVVTVAFSPDAKLLAVTSHDTAIKIWDTATGKEVRSLSVPPVPCPIALSPDGKLLAAAPRAGPISLWDCESGQKCDEWQFSVDVRGLTFAPDGRHLITANNNGTLYVLRLDPAAK